MKPWLRAGPALPTSWTEDEEHRLKKEYQKNMPLADIATRHGRTVRAIEARLEKLGLLRADQRTTGNPFLGAADVKEGKT
jgi:hypothetical protein